MTSTTTTTTQEHGHQPSSEVESQLSTNFYIESKVMTAVALSEISAGGPGVSWFIPAVGDPACSLDLCRDDRTYQPLAAAPPQLLAIARQLEQKVEGVWLPASESDTKGRAFVITISNNSNVSGDPDDDDDLERRWTDNQVRDLCLDALGIIDEARAHATLRRRDWAVEVGRNGFCYTDEDFEDEIINDEIESDRAKIVAATQVMVDELHDGFEFNFDEKVICGPVLYGGFVGHNSIVGILSMRVWT